MKKIRGILVSYEGGEGSGKSSVHRLLKERFAKTHPGQFMFVNDPSSDTEELRQIRRLLLSKEFSYGKAAELMLYGSARAELVEKLIEPALAQGINVVSDRFYDSTTVYQGMLKGHDMMKLQAMNAEFCGNLVPDVTFLFDVDARTGLARSNGRLDEGKIDEGRWESMGLAVHERINAHYRTLAMANGRRFHVLNSNAMTIEEMADAVERRVRDMLVSRMTHTTGSLGVVITEELWEDWKAMGLVDGESKLPFVDTTPDKDAHYKFEVCCDNCRYSCTYYEDEPCASCNRGRAANGIDNWTDALPYPEERRTDELKGD